MLPFLPPFIPNLIQVAPFAIAFAFLFAAPLRRHAGAFYAFWTVAVVAVSWPDPVLLAMGNAAPASVVAYQSYLDSLESSQPLIGTVTTLLTSSFTGVCFYLIVMFSGALEKTPAVKKLLSVRSELSVIGGIVIMGHVVRVINFPLLFLSPMAQQVWGSAASGAMFVASVIIGPLLTLVFLIPWITSFKVVRRRMSHATWKKTQVLAYPFMALMIAQGFFLALGHCLYGYPYDGATVTMALMGNPVGWLGSFAQNVATAWMYLALGGAYLTLRLRKLHHARGKEAHDGHESRRILGTSRNRRA